MNSEFRVNFMNSKIRKLSFFVFGACEYPKRGEFRCEFQVPEKAVKWIHMKNMNSDWFGLFSLFFAISLQNSLNTFKIGRIFDLSHFMTGVSLNSLHPLHINVSRISFPQWISFCCSKLELYSIFWLITRTYLSSKGDKLNFQSEFALIPISF